MALELSEDHFSLKKGHLTIQAVGKLGKKAEECNSRLIKFDVKIHLIPQKGNIVVFELQKREIAIKEKEMALRMRNSQGSVLVPTFSTYDD